MARIEQDRRQRSPKDAAPRRDVTPPRIRSGLGAASATAAHGLSDVPRGTGAASHRTLYDQLPLMVLSLDRRGGVVSVNEQAAGELGYARSELVGRSVFDIVHPADREAARRHLRWAFDRSDEISRWSLRKVRRNGTTLWARNTARVVHAPGGAPRMLLVCEDDGERRAAKRRVAEYRDRLRELNAKLARAEENEARRIARLLHDELGQTLATARLKVCGLRDAATSEDQVGRLDELCADLDRSTEVSRSLTFQLSPPILDDLGLAAGLEALGERAGKDHGLRFEFELGEGWSPPSEATALVLYRVVRELLHNVTKHARASQVRLALDGAPFAIRLVLEDDGVGLTAPPAGTAGRSLGLFHVRERIERLGGRFEIGQVSRLGGTRAVLELPLDGRPETERSAEARTP